MRKYYFTAVVGLLFLGCTVDNDELDLNNDQTLNANLHLDDDECISDQPWILSDKGNEFGKIIINNDSENISISFLAEEGFRITGIKWEMATNWEDIPHNNGGIIPGQLEHHNKFNDGVSSYESTMAEDDAECIFLAAKVDFKNSSNRSFSAWVGNHYAGSNNSKYLYSCFCEPQEDPTCTISAGSDKEKTISRDFVRANLKYAWQVEEFLLGMLDEGVPHTGTFDPTITELIASYREKVFQTFVTTYTITEGECSSSVKLSVTVGAYHDYQL